MKTLKTVKFTTKWIMVLALATYFASTNAMAQTNVTPEQARAIARPSVDIMRPVT